MQNTYLDPTLSDTGVPVKSKLLEAMKGFGKANHIEEVNVQASTSARGGSRCRIMLKMCFRADMQRRLR